MKEEEKENTKIEYKGKCIRMHDDTWKLLKLKRSVSGLSWNRYLLHLLAYEEKEKGKKTKNNFKLYGDKTFIKKSSTKREK